MKKFAVLGHPIGHSLSPAMHLASFESIGFAGSYERFDVTAEELAGALVCLRDEGYRGLNLTVPLKEEALRLISDLDESACLLGAVNTVTFSDAGVSGACTDGYGFLRAVQEAFGECIAGRHVFFCGCGGAGRAAALTAAQQGAARITLSARSEARAVPLAEEIRMKFPATQVSVSLEQEEKIRAARSADLVVQASPLGLKPDDPSPLPAEAFRAGQYVFDMLYNPPETELMRLAQAAGARAVNGLDMLVHQGARSFEIWTGLQADVPAMRQALLDASV